MCGEVDMTMAGRGRITVDVRGEVTKPLIELAERCDGLHTVTFVPQECCLHSIVIMMNGHPVPGELFSLDNRPTLNGRNSNGAWRNIILVSGRVSHPQCTKMWTAEMQTQNHNKI